MRERMGRLGAHWKLWEGAESHSRPTSASNHLNSASRKNGTPPVVQLLFLQPALVENIQLQLAIKNFRTLHIDYPKVNYAKGFRGYCNGLMSYVWGRQQSWYCPKIHYVLHALWTAIKKFCKYSESFCENYNEYCTVTQDSFPLTICSLSSKQPPTSCYYTSTLTDQRLYLLCSQKYDAEPIDIMGLY
ncbi:probable inactive ribonuclease-like protein 13 [Monodon monoceros]|uniref:Probable inactive ribonuclease-like protein 13 n=1 Tax=Delphinapterus leucas TaxID=9749 RepID=A0A2Y9P6T0_DELLE|nr:probable inactive ribonuclease-like protein 13 [Delphinapterus leucas]XP_029092957.1 probable inactive ribonuclease-like protein 13 [Monodon monoceros]